MQEQKTKATRVDDEKVVDTKVVTKPTVKKKWDEPNPPGSKLKRKMRRRLYNR